MAGSKRVKRGGGQFMVSSEQYLELLERMARYADEMRPRPDCIVGVIRSGLFPAVYLSHQLKLPYFGASDVDHIPLERLSCPLITDTCVWSGGTVRRLQSKLIERGCAEVPVLSMFIRNFPRPEVDELHFLEASDHIMQFWYDYEGLVKEVAQRKQVARDSKTSE